MANIISRIAHFLQDVPIRSEATGMFIERDDLRGLILTIDTLKIEAGWPKQITALSLTKNTLKEYEQERERDFYGFTVPNDGIPTPVLLKPGSRLVIDENGTITGILTPQE